MTSAYLFLDTRRPNKHGEYRIKIRVVHNRASKEIKLKYSCKENQWIGSRVKNYPNSGRVNAYLKNEEARINQIIIENITEIDNLNINELKQLILNKAGLNNNKSKNDLTLSKWGKVIVERNNKANKHSTANWYNDVIRKVLKYNRDKDLHLSDIDVTFIKEMEVDHLSRGGSINGFATFMTGLRAMLNKANQEFEDCNFKPFDKYKIRKVKTKKRAIKIDVINDIRALNIDKNSNKETLAEWHTKNYLLFMFNNRGMNFIDITKLKKSQIIETIYKGGKLMEGILIYTRSKTSKHFQIRLTNESLDILNDYDIHSLENEDFVFPIGFSNTEVGMKNYKQKRKNFNDRSNRLAKLAGHDIKITSYVIRHSWASIAKSKGISKDIIGESLGHEDTKVTEVYLENFENKVLDDANDIIVS